MITYSGDTALDLGLNIYLGTSVAQADPIGVLSASCLQKWASSGKITLKDSGVFAKWMGRPDGVTSFFVSDDITIYGDAIRAAGIDQHVFMAIVLAHEGVHASQRSLELESEVDAWGVTVKTYRELIKTAVQVDSTQYQIAAPNIFKAYVAAGPFFDKNQMIDYVIKVSNLYREKVGANWVKSNCDKWGGLLNRRPETISVYLGELGKGGALNASFIMQMLEDTLPAIPAGQRQGVINDAGPALKRVLQAMWAGYSRRLDALQKMMGVRL